MRTEQRKKTDCVVSSCEKSEIFQNEKVEMHAGRARVETGGWAGGRGWDK